MGFYFVDARTYEVHMYVHAPRTLVGNIKPFSTKYRTLPTRSERVERRVEKVDFGIVYLWRALQAASSLALEWRVDPFSPLRCLVYLNLSLSRSQLASQSVLMLSHWVGALLPTRSHASWGEIPLCKVSRSCMRGLRFSVTELLDL